MRFSMNGRALVILVAAGAMAAVPLATPASAAATGGQCTKLATKTVKSKLTATLTSCTPVAATGGKGGGTFATATGATSGTLAITITWAAGHGTTKGTVKFGPAAGKGFGKCPAKTTSRVALTGTVVGGTGTAFKTITKGQKITGSVCVGASSDSLEPGVPLKF
jgi:hypothetical protein